MNLRMYGFIDNNNVSKENIIEKYNKLLNQMDFKKNMKYYLSQEIARMKM